MPPATYIGFGGRGLLTPRVDSSTELTRIFGLARIA